MRRITASFGWLVLLLAGWLLLLLLLLMLMLMLHSANACTFKYDQWVYSNIEECATRACDFLCCCARHGAKKKKHTIVTDRLK